MRYGLPHKGNEKEYRRLQAAAQRQKDPISYLIKQARYRAKKSGIEFDITKDDLEIPEYCPVFGLRLQFTPGYRSNSSFSLDRQDNSKGYTKDNVRVISFKANQYKGDMTVEQVEALLRYMKGEI